MQTSIKHTTRYKPPYRTIIIEDQTLFRDVLIQLIEADRNYLLVGAANSGTEGWEMCKNKQPDLVLLDLQIPELDGIELGERIRRQMKDVRILALTALTDSYTTNRVYEAGFHGYLEKTQPINALRNAMLTVAGGGSYFTEIVLENIKEMQTDPNAVQKLLSSKEIRILTEVAKGLNSQEIAELLELSIRTVENHRHRIMQRLEIKNVSGLVRFAIENKLLNLD